MTVEEWLNNDSLGIDIWNKKYRVDNESLDQWFDRVSGGDEKLKELIIAKKFLFAGRTLSNRGTKKGSYSNCFTGDVLVRTRRGLIPIKDITTDDYVLTDKNRFCKVNNVFCREYNGDLYRFTSHEIYHPITCTPNHKFLTNHGWKRADRIFPFGVTYSGQGNDKLKTAYDANRIFMHSGEGEIINFIDGLELGDNKRVCHNDNKAWLECYFNASNVSNKPSYIWRKTTNKVNKTALFDSDFAYFVGRWLGDGSITRRRGSKNHSILQIVFNATKEKDSADKCANIGKKLFGIDPSIRTTKQNVIAVRFENEIIASWFYRAFGEKCDGKSVPSKYLGNYNMLLGLFDADGHLTSHGAFKITLKNKNLITWAKDTCYLNNINTSIIKDISDRQLNTYELTISVAQANGRLNSDLTKSYFDKDSCNKVLAEYIVVPTIDILENQSTLVYNLSVEEDHTYTVNGIVVHNCYCSGKCPDSLEGIMQTASKIAQTFKAQGGQGLSLSDIRPKGSMVNGTFKSDGIVPFMEIFNTVTASISQGGSRRGALMMSLDVNHPQIKDFITIKSNHDKINNANLSVEIDDKFMEAVERYYENGTVIKYIVPNKFKGAEDIEYEITPIEIYKLMMHHAWKDAEPGVMFMNKFSNYNLMQHVHSYQIYTSNPCGN